MLYESKASQTMVEKTLIAEAFGCVETDDKFSIEEQFYKKLPVEFANAIFCMEGFLRSSNTAILTTPTSPGTISTAPASGSASTAPPQLEVDEFEITEIRRLLRKYTQPQGNQRTF